MEYVKYEAHCPYCGVYHEVYVRRADWLLIGQGVAIQKAMPNPIYSATEREQIISGICPNCQEEIFGGDE